MEDGRTDLREPVELEFYPFLSGERREEVDRFLAKLDSRFRTFAYKRYCERKKIHEIAKEMRYSERNLFKFRKRILMCWYFQSQIIS